MELDACEQVQQLFERQAGRTPDTPAIIAGAHTLSYRELDHLANGVAHRLVAAGVGRGSPVGVLVERDERLLAAILGVLKAGAAYVPIDVTYPAQRVGFIAQDTGMALAVTTSRHADRLREHGVTPLLIDDLPAQPAAPAGAGHASAHDPAYVIYTSGSTGTPKGVVVEHHSVVNLMRWAVDTYSAAELSGVLAATSVCFDVSVIEMFAPLAAGGTVIMAEDLLALPQLPARDQVRLMCGVPSALSALLRFPLPAGIHTVAPAGEALPRALVEQLYAQPGVKRVINCFGPTECTVYCAAYDIARDEPGDPPIGTSVAGAVLSVRDPDTRQTVDEGELWVGGPVLARGYHNRPDLTGQRFVTTPDGQRWYRTGDLVRRRAGILHYLGRLDDQVKVRGYRVELGEVQAALISHPDVHQAVVLAPPDRHGTRRLIGYVEPVSAPVTETQLRAWLRDRLPSYLLPWRVLVLERMPLGPTGKVDRAALPVPDHRDHGTPYTAPRNPTETLITDTIADVLGLPEIGVDDDFAILGGHSLAAARVVARLADQLGHPVPLGWFLTEPTAAALARRIERTGGAAGRAGPTREAGRKVSAITDLQREILVLRALRPGSTTTVAVRLRLTGGCEPDRVRQALADVVHRHEVLRTTFADWDDGPVAVVHPPAPVPLTEVDLARTPADQRESQLARVAADIAGTAFDLASDVPLVRAALVRTGDDRAELLIAVDHAAFDGYSIGLLMSELAAGLAGRSVPEPPVQVSDVARFEQELAADTGAVDALRTFWRGQLADLSPPGHLAGSHTDQVTGRGARISQTLAPDLVRRLDALAAECRVSRFAVFAAALAALLHRLTGEATPVIGTSAAVRDRPGLDRVIGPLVRVLPVALPASGDPTVRELVARAARASLTSLAHLDLTLAELHRCAGFARPPGSVLCPVILTMQPEDVPVSVEVGGVRVALAGELPTGMAVTDLTIFVNQVAPAAVGVTPAVEVQAEYDTGRYREPDVATLLGLWLRLLDQMATDPDQPISQLELVDREQQRSLVEQGRGAPLPAERPATVVAAVEARAAERPEVVAVAADDGELTFGELVHRSHRLAAALAGAGTARGDRVGVCIPRDRLLPVTLLGVLRAGAAYVPFDPDHPAERLAWLAEDSAATVVVSRGDALPAARAIPGVTVIDLDRLPDTAGAPPSPPAPGDLAYVLYTSGSTGRPKGVEVSHASLADHTTAIRSIPGIGADDTVLALAPLTFDASATEIWAALVAGARCLVVRRDRVLDARALARQLNDVSITVVNQPPTVVRMLLAAGWRGDPALRLWFGGEALDPALVREVRPLVGAVWNAYGPTETTSLSAVHRVVGDIGATVPIGRPLPGEWVYVMDASGRLVPTGITGELWIGGAGLARGYRNRPELTRSVFVPDPFVPGGRCYRTGDLVRWNRDGELEYLGRVDDQIKLRGQRIELGEIEAVLHEHPRVRQAAVTVHGTGPQAGLVGYLAPADADPDDVARFLRQRLPRYMVPDRWRVLAQLPSTPSGKVDRRSLPDPAPETGTDRPPETDMERYLAKIWTEVLGATDPGRQSNFFALGGNSFAATRVIARIRSGLGCDLPVLTLFDQPSLAEFAAEVERAALARLAAAEAGQ